MSFNTFDSTCSILLWGFTDSVRESLSLKTPDQNFINMHHRGDPDIRYSHVMSLDSYPWDHKYCNEVEYKKILNNFYSSTQAFGRCHYLKAGIAREPIDYSYRIRSCYAFFSKYLSANPVSFALFANIPHEGPDNVLASLLAIRGIPVYACFQLPYDRFCLYSISSFLETAIIKPSQLINLSQKTYHLISKYIHALSGKKNHFYMNDLTPYYHPTLLSLKQSLVSPLSALKRACSVVYVRLQHEIFRYSLRSIQRIVSLPSKDYIFVPLHLQPELTTSSFGGIHTDQTILLSIVSAIAAQYNVIVLCKENPKQSYSHRSSLFFSAVNCIDNLYFVDSSVPTSTLIRHASAVATVNGTAGVEAAYHGVPVLPCGDAWWSFLSSVIYDYRELEEVIKISKFSKKLSHCPKNSFEDELIDFTVSSTFPGIVDADYLMDCNSNISSNEDVLVGSISLIISSFA